MVYAKKSSFYYNPQKKHGYAELPAKVSKGFIMDAIPSTPFIPNDSTLAFKATRFEVYTIKQDARTREMISHSGAVVILPFIDDDKIILIQNERFAVGETLWELPAGTLEKDEVPEATAVRELREETGYSCQQIIPLTCYYSSPGFCNERMFAYAAMDLTPGMQDLDETEKITLSIFTWKECLEMIKTGKIKDAKTIATLLYYDIFVRKSSEIQ
jgi:ADP-ribose pyrophosphatase